MSILSSWFLQRRFFIVVLSMAVGFVAAALVPVLLPLMFLLLALVGLTVVADTILLYGRNQGITATRIMATRLSNGDENTVSIQVWSTYRISVRLDVIDELPFQFQMRDMLTQIKIASGAAATISYSVRPTQRGVYDFGAVNVFVHTVLGLVQRRIRCDVGRAVPVYPSYLQMRSLELIAFSHRLQRQGLKRIRRIGHTSEFEKINHYTSGDDVRTINWKATARSSDLMVNLYQDERAQDVYSIIDCGRVMKMPFEGLTLLDHSVNAVLALSNVAMQKHDRIGMITYGRAPGTVVRADGHRRTLGRMMEGLYAVETDFYESNDEHAFTMVRRNVRQRSLLMLYTNIESMVALRRRLLILRALARTHVLVVVFFENTELRDLLRTDPTSVEDIYTQTIVRTMTMQKREIVAELRRHGIHGLLTTPQDLSIHVINTYLDFKARGLI
ncbi:DUF58 domain-containing protein [soil metagenome]